MEFLLTKIIEQLQSMDWGPAQDNVDAAIAYLSCAIQNVRDATPNSESPKM